MRKCFCVTFSNLSSVKWQMATALSDRAVKENQKKKQRRRTRERATTVAKPQPYRLKGYADT